MNSMDWLIWLGVALAAGVGEVLTVDFILLMIGGGALGAALSAGLGVPFPVQVVVFAVATIVLLVTARPPLKHWAARTPVHITNTGALVGRDAVVLTPVSGTTGEVKLAGEVWTARSGEAYPLEPGSAVVVVRIEGATAIVAPATQKP
jgi:membrane protein implicated in regulation of membrane protease activity